WQHVILFVIDRHHYGQHVEQFPEQTMVTDARRKCNPGTRLDGLTKNHGHVRRCCGPKWARKLIVAAGSIPDTKEECKIIIDERGHVKNPGKMDDTETHNLRTTICLTRPRGYASSSH